MAACLSAESDFGIDQRFAFDLSFRWLDLSFPCTKQEYGLYPRWLAVSAELGYGQRW